MLISENPNKANAVPTDKRGEHSYVMFCLY